MLRTATIALLTVFGFLNLKETNSNQTISSSKIEDPAETRFKTFCISCHKPNENSFANRVWKYGNTKPQVIKSIKNGSADAGMPPFAAAFTDAQLDELADYVINKLQNATETKVKNATGIYKSNGMTIKLDTIAKGLDSPWGMVFLPNNDLIATDRDGKIYRIDSKKVKTQIAGAPKVLVEGQGGLLDIALHPKFAQNNIIYLSYSKPKDTLNAVWATTAIMRAKLEGDKLVEQKDIFIAQPYQSTKHHYGSRIVFDKDGYMFFSVGERGGHFKWPQKLDNDLGKIHRLKDDGTVPSDNPFVNTPNARASIWSYGHRNPQGLYIDASTGIIWEDEHGPKGGDELNIVQKGANYGWPVISYGINYDGSILTEFTAKEGMTQPQHYWVPSIGPSGLVKITGTKYKPWEGQYLVGSMSFEYLNRCKIDGKKVVEQERLLPNIGRVRSIKMSNDGYIYVGVEKPGVIYRLMPL